MQTADGQAAAAAEAKEKKDQSRGPRATFVVKKKAQ